MFGVSEKRLRGQIFDEMRSDTPPRYNIECNIFSPTRCSHSRLIRRVSFVNKDRRELKETSSSISKIPCQAIMFGVSEKRPSSI
ncbi:hypothetical protein T01_14593, partial [Trichinella spiralis]